jgi:hypothetical protein
MKNSIKITPRQARDLEKIAGHGNAGDDSPRDLDIVIARAIDEFIERHGSEPEETGKNKKKESTTMFSKLSMVLCMIASACIATMPETKVSILFWSIYTAGAFLGIVHFKKTRDRYTMYMYVFWFVLDIIAVARLVIF